MYCMRFSDAESVRAHAMSRRSHGPLATTRHEGRKNGAGSTVKAYSVGNEEFIVDLAFAGRAKEVVSVPREVAIALLFGTWSVKVSHSRAVGSFVNTEKPRQRACASAVHAQVTNNPSLRYGKCKRMPHRTSTRKVARMQKHGPS